MSSISLWECRLFDTAAHGKLRGGGFNGPFLMSCVVTVFQLRGVGGGSTAGDGSAAMGIFGGSTFFFMSRSIGKT